MQSFSFFRYVVLQVNSWFRILSLLLLQPFPPFRYVYFLLSGRFIFLLSGRFIFLLSSRFIFLLSGRFISSFQVGLFSSFFLQITFYLLFYCIFNLLWFRKLRVPFLLWIFIPTKRDIDSI